MTIDRVIKLYSVTECSRGTVRKLARKTCNGTEMRTQIIFNPNSSLSGLGIISFEFPTDTLQKGEVKICGKSFTAYYKDIESFKQAWIHHYRILDKFYRK